MGSVAGYWCAVAAGRPQAHERLTLEFRFLEFLCVIQINPAQDLLAGSWKPVGNLPIRVLSWLNQPYLRPRLRVAGRFSQNNQWLISRYQQFALATQQQERFLVGFSDETANLVHTRSTWASDIHANWISVARHVCAYRTLVTSHYFSRDCFTNFVREH